MKAAPADRWITFRAGELKLPRCCCECLQPIGPGSNVRLRSSAKGELPFLVCGACRPRILGRMWFKAFERLMLALGLAALVWLIPGVDRVGHWIMFTMAATFLFFVGLFVNAEQAKPYVIKQVDARWLVYRLRMKNPELHAMVWEEMRPKEVAKPHAQSWE